MFSVEMRNTKHFIYSIRKRNDKFVLLKWNKKWFICKIWCSMFWKCLAHF